MKNLHYLLMIFAIVSCKHEPNAVQNGSPVRVNFVAGCLKSANASDVQKVQSICECVYDTSEKLYENPEKWQKIAAQFNETEIRDEKLKSVLNQSLAQCKK